MSVEEPSTKTFDTTLQPKLTLNLPGRNYPSTPFLDRDVVMKSAASPPSTTSRNTESRHSTDDDDIDEDDVEDEEEVDVEQCSDGEDAKDSSEPPTKKVIH